MNTIILDGIILLEQMIVLLLETGEILRILQLILMPEYLAHLLLILFFLDPILEVLGTLPSSVK